MYELFDYTNSIFLFIYSILIMWKIKKELLEKLCEASKGNYPKEFLCFLSGKEEQINGIVMLPNTGGEDYVEINTNLIPLDNSIIGTIHSHPKGGNYPSNEDKKFFRKYKINGIINYTNKIENIKFFNEKSKEIKIAYLD